MTKIFEPLIHLKDNIIQTLNESGTEFFETKLNPFNRPQQNWVNRVWQGPHFRRAHLDVVDARKESDFWVMHLCLFPHLHADAPIYGMDFIASHKLITGAFLDYSPTTAHQHNMLQDFNQHLENIHWKRERKIPDWGQPIFSKYMLAVSAIKQPHEIKQLIDITKKTLQHYIENISHYNHVANIEDVKQAHNHYCRQQQNPQVRSPRVMKALNINLDELNTFIEKCLFPTL